MNRQFRDLSSVGCARSGSFIPSSHRNATGLLVAVGGVRRAPTQRVWRGAYDSLASRCVVCAKESIGHGCLVASDSVLRALRTGVGLIQISPRLAWARHGIESTRRLWTRWRTRISTRSGVATVTARFLLNCSRASTIIVRSVMARTRQTSPTS